MTVYTLVMRVDADQYIDAQEIREEVAEACSRVAFDINIIDVREEEETEQA